MSKWAHCWVLYSTNCLSLDCGCVCSCWFLRSWHDVCVLISFVVWQAAVKDRSAWSWTAGSGGQDGVLHLLSKPSGGWSCHRRPAGEEWRYVQIHLTEAYQKCTWCLSIFVILFPFSFYVCLSQFPHLSLSGALELADASSDLPGLKYMPGITSWKVINYYTVFSSSF